MLELLKSAEFDRWLRSLKDRQAIARIAARLDRLALGNPGDAKPVGSGVMELRIDHGPGYRIYYVRKGSSVLLLLIGGDKASQQKDIARSKELAAVWKEN